MINRLDIKNYRSFDSSGVNLNDLQKINLFIGKNNSGKSNVLKFLSLLHSFGGISNKTISTPPRADFFDLDVNNQIEFTVKTEIPENNVHINELIRLAKSQSGVFLTYKIQGNSLTLVNSFVHKAGEEELRDVARIITGTTGGRYEDRLSEVIRIGGVDGLFQLPEVISIDEFRNLKNNQEAKEQLEKLINFDYENTQLEEKLDQLRLFISKISGNEIGIRIPDLQKEIELIVANKRTLPISSIGTGYHEIVLLSLKLLSSSKAIVCIDEPELHLHPGIQRAFLRFISENTDHQYFIATHSNSFLDYEVKKRIFYTKLLNSVTTVTPCDEIDDLSGLLSDLGIRSSELLQTNGVIWVEGPSDRIYIKKWLELHNSNLKEGFHYTFQFYGGSVLKNYAVEDTTFNQMINLLFINRNSFVVMDSDMSGDFTEENLSEQKKRIIAESRKKNIKWWVTDGRTVENYLSNAVLKKFSGKNVTRVKFSKIESFCPEYKDKVKDSRQIVSLMDNDELDKAGFNLKDRITELGDVVASWNQ